MGMSAKIKGGEINGTGEMTSNVGRGAVDSRSTRVRVSSENETRGAQARGKIRGKTHWN
jgi:hypothetical protein